jgi:hypothetical protein
MPFPGIEQPQNEFFRAWSFHQFVILSIAILSTRKKENTIFSKLLFLSILKDNLKLKIFAMHVQLTQICKAKGIPQPGNPCRREGPVHLTS